MNQLARNILAGLVRSKFITPQEARSKSAKDAVEETAAWYQDDEEIGSSDMTFIKGAALEAMGKKISYKTGRLNVVETTYKLTKPGVDQGMMAELKNNVLKKGDAITYLGHPGKIVSVSTDSQDRTWYNIDYTKGNGKTRVNQILSTDGSVKKSIGESMNEEAKTEQEMLADMSKIKKDLATAQQENNKNKTESNTAKVEAKKEQLKRANAKLQDIRKAKTKKKPAKNEANLTGSSYDLPKKMPKASGIMKLAVNNIYKYPNTKYGNSDKKLQQRADLFMKDNPKVNQKHIKDAFNLAQKVYDYQNKLFSAAKDDEKRLELARIRNTFSSILGMLARAFKGNIWHDQPQNESVESDFYGGKHDFHDRNKNAREFNKNVKLTDVPSQVMKIWKKMSHKQRLNMLSRLGFNYTAVLSQSRLIKKEVDALARFARYYKANKWDKMKVLKLMTMELNNIPPPNKKTHILEAKSWTNDEVEKMLMKQKFRVDRVVGDTVHMSRRKGGSSELATIEDGEINGEDPAEWIKYMNESLRLNESKSFTKLAKELESIQSQMKTLAAEYKKKKDSKADVARIVAALKKLTNKKNQLETEVNSALTDIDKDAEFIGEADINEGYKVTKKIWDVDWKNNFDKREEALLSILKDPDEVDTWIEKSWNNLPNDAFAMQIHESKSKESAPVNEAMGNIYQVRYHEGSYMFKDERITGKWAEVIKKAKQGLMKADAYRHSTKGYWATVEPFKQELKSPDWKQWTILLNTDGSGYHYHQHKKINSTSGQPGTQPVNKLTEGNIKLVGTQRVTGGMTPKIRFTFSDGTEITSKPDGIGVDDYDEIYQNLISDWFQKN